MYDGNMAFTSPAAVRFASASPSCVSRQQRPVVRASASQTRRSFLSVAAVTLLFSVGDISSADDQEETTLQFSEYRGPISLGFSFMYPVEWKVAKKPIKTHLSEVIVSSKNVSGTSAGLVVDQVKISSIENFGSATEVGERVVALERKKDSTQSAQLLSSMAENRDGLTYYIVDYVVDSTRGPKHYLAKATITGKQLYVFTAQSKVDNFGADSSMLQRMIDSFSVRPQYT